MVVDGEIVNFLGKCHNINLTIGEYLTVVEYVLNIIMITIQTTGAYVVLGI